MVSLLIIIFILVVVFAVFSRNRIISEKWLNGKKTFWIFAIYVLVLVVSAGYYVSFLADNTPVNEQVTAEEVNEASTALVNQSKDGQFEKLEENYLQKEWTIETDVEDIYLKNEENNLSIYFKQEESERIKAAYYHPPSTVAGEKIDRKYDIDVILNGNTLAVETKNQSIDRLTYRGYKEEFPFQQFSKSSVNRRDGIEGGQGVVVIQIPENIEVSAQDAYDVKE